jgi:hypothetical protein
LNVLHSADEIFCRQSAKYVTTGAYHSYRNFHGLARSLLRDTYAR